MSVERARRGYADGPCYAELAAIIGAGGLHVVLELSLSEPTAWLYNAAVSLGFLGYLGWRARRAPGAIRAWGMRRDNVWPAASVQLRFAVPSAFALLAYGAATGALPLPWSFWFTVGLYPIWGIAQQFALQNLIARNLVGVLSHPVAVAGTATVLFAAAHYPRMALVWPTLLSGFFFTMLYRREPNLWVVGFAHGILGSLVVYLVLQQDPGAAIWELAAPGTDGPLEARRWLWG